MGMDFKLGHYLAVLYLAFVIFVFVGLKYADPGWAEGGIPLLIVGLPWSIPVLAAAFALSLIPGFDKILATEGGNFFMFVVVCGGLNIALVLGPLKVWRLIRERAAIRALIAIIAMVLIGVAHRWAKDRRRCPRAE